MNAGFLLNFFDPQFVHVLKKIKEGKVRALEYLPCNMYHAKVLLFFSFTIQFTNKKAMQN